MLNGDNILWKSTRCTFWGTDTTWGRTLRIIHIFAVFSQIEGDSNFISCNFYCYYVVIYTTQENNLKSHSHWEEILGDGHYRIIYTYDKVSFSDYYFQKYNAMKLKITIHKSMMSQRYYIIIFTKTSQYVVVKNK